ncbi:ribosomal-processing cysteine protease Prp [Tissierella sp.]|uniref:ribosomal-processing cysteine protease Prp n=1 Tax=Tissierella sp. TaxID=41274 RepID=UPI00285FAA73|nr:ribosomal-processing cysteine protease Prp [Tissierella sp.]MDR7857074.1 ribosomal-processing cysteine protease Prp [Tissierella sp.]
MIIAKIYKDKNNYIKKYTIKGHAKYDEHGKDIICAAISVLSQTALLSLVEVCCLDERDIKYSIDEKTGFLDVNLPKNIEISILEKTQIVLNSLVVGINSVIESYPQYVTLEYREV